MELPSFQESIFLYGQVNQMCEGRQKNPASSFQEEPIKAITTKGSTTLVSSEGVP